ncbi:MAG: hypothetical protein LUC86_01375 [Prevotellaceae bacterium]|nr:hypothetical protein [Prevotellaceae bacterium]
MQAKVVTTERAASVATDFFYGTSATRSTSPALCEVMNSQGLQYAAGGDRKR